MVLLIAVYSVSSNSLALGYVEATCDETATEVQLLTAYNEYQSVKDEPAELEDYQVDYLYALGVSAEEIAELTNGELASILKERQIVKPEHLVKYIDADAFAIELTESSEIAKELNLVLTTDNAFVRAYEVVSDVRATTYHYFRGTAATNLLGAARYFHKDAYSTSLYDSESNSYVSIPYDPEPGTRAYELKISLLTDQLLDVSYYVKKLYNTSSTSGIAYNYYLYGQKSGSSTNIHEGIDSQRGSGYSVYSISSGTVVKKTSSGSTGLSLLGVYYPTYDITIFYMHMNLSSSLPAVGESISKGQLIGTESNLGAGSVHTHLQIESGQQTYAAVGNDTTLESLSPYSYLWFFCYYQS